MASMPLLLLSLSIYCRLVALLLGTTCSSANAMGTHNYIGECAIGILLLYTFVARAYARIVDVWENGKFDRNYTFEMKGKTELALQLHFYHFQFSFLMCVMCSLCSMCECVWMRTGSSFEEEARARAFTTLRV